MITDFRLLLQVAITPLVLISGVGLLLLSITNRYNHALDRTRQLNREVATVEAAYKENLRHQQLVLWKRCGILRKSIGFVVLSVLLSGMLILFMILHALAGINLDILNVILLLAGIMCIVISTMLFFLDVSLSLEALKLDLERFSEVGNEKSA
jgi:hypothetical protein